VNNEGYYLQLKYRVNVDNVTEGEGRITLTVSSRWGGTSSYRESHQGELVNDLNEGNIEKKILGGERPQ